MEPNYYALACALAEDAVQNHILTRRGIWYLEKEDLVCIFDNNPYSDDSNARERQTKRIIQRLNVIGIELVAQGSDQDAYSKTIILNCSRDRIAEVEWIVREEVAATLRELE